MRYESLGIQIRVPKLTPKLESFFQGLTHPMNSLLGWNSIIINQINYHAITKELKATIEDQQLKPNIKIAQPNAGTLPFEKHLLRDTSHARGTQSATRPVLYATTAGSKFCFLMAQRNFYESFAQPSETIKMATKILPPCSN